MGLYCSLSTPKASFLWTNANLKVGFFFFLFTKLRKIQEKGIIAINKTTREEDFYYTAFKEIMNAFQKEKNEW
jgi:hypothetical protein